MPPPGRSASAAAAAVRGLGRTPVFKPPSRSFLEGSQGPPRAVLLEPDQEDPELQQHLQPAADPIGPPFASNPPAHDRVCQVCDSSASSPVDAAPPLAKPARYSCPSCHALTCGLECFQRHSARCSDLFHSRQVESELRSLPKAEEAGRRQMQEILRRVRGMEESRLDLASPSAAEDADVDAEAEAGVLGDPLGGPQQGTTTIAPISADVHLDAAEDDGSTTVPGDLPDALAAELEQLSLLLNDGGQSSPAGDQELLRKLSPAARQRFEMFLRNNLFPGPPGSGPPAPPPLHQALRARSPPASRLQEWVSRWRPWWCPLCPEAPSPAASGRGPSAGARSQSREGNRGNATSPGLVRELPWVGSEDLAAEYLASGALAARVQRLHASDNPTDTEVEGVELLLRMWPRRASVWAGPPVGVSTPPVDSPPCSAVDGLADPPPPVPADWPSPLPSANSSRPSSERMLPGLAAILVAYAHVQRSWAGSVPRSDLPQAVRVLLCLPGVFEVADGRIVNHASVPEMLRWLMDDRFGCSSCSGGDGGACPLHPGLPPLACGRAAKHPRRAHQTAFAMSTRNPGWALDCLADAVRLLERPELILRALGQIRGWMQRVSKFCRSAESPEGERTRKLLKRALLKLEFLARGVITLSGSGGGGSASVGGFGDATPLRQLQSQLLEGWADRILSLIGSLP